MSRDVDPSAYADMLDTLRTFVAATDADAGPLRRRASLFAYLSGLTEGQPDRLTGAWFRAAVEVAREGDVR